jgi:pimeloyl-ACP methyl ester carboxylesterase
MDTENQITLPDGRKLSYAEFGARDGSPVMYFHGAPSSRLEPLFIGDDVWTRLGLRVIAPDRPGMGLSDWQPNRGFSDWPRDTTALADALGLSRFSIIGFSGGAGYAAVCAARIPERLRTVAVISGGWRMDWPEARANLKGPFKLVQWFARRAPLMLRMMLKAMAATSQGDPAKQLASMKSRFPQPDYDALAQPGRMEAFGKGVRESMRQGTKGPSWDMRQYVHEFDFRAEEVQIPVTFYHGEQDANVPFALVQRVVRELPQARLVSYQNEAHLSTLSNHIREIAESLRMPA